MSGGIGSTRKRGYYHKDEVVMLGGIEGFVG
jgi:hypothetical protein